MRARNIKPGFFKNEKLADLPPLARLLFVGLWCMADREGRLEDRPKRIRAEIIPFDGENVEELLEMLAKGSDPFIARYEVNGEKYIQIINFLRHQNPHRREAGSEIPALPTKGRPRHGLGHDKARPRTVQGTTSTGTSPADSPSLIPDSPSLIPHSLIPDSSTRPSTRLPHGQFGNVMLTDEEFGKLTVKRDYYIDRLSEYLESSGKKYRSHFATILSWMRKDGVENFEKSPERGKGVEVIRPDHGPTEIVSTPEERIDCREILQDRLKELWSK